MQAIQNIPDIQEVQAIQDICNETQDRVVLCFLQLRHRLLGLVPTEATSRILQHPPLANAVSTEFQQSCSTGRSFDLRDYFTNTWNNVITAIRRMGGVDSQQLSMERIPYILDFQEDQWDPQWTPLNSSANVHAKPLMGWQSGSPDQTSSLSTIPRADLEGNTLRPLSLSPSSRPSGSTVLSDISERDFEPAKDWLRLSQPDLVSNLEGVRESPVHLPPGLTTECNVDEEIMRPEEWTQRLKNIEKDVWENSYFRYQGTCTDAALTKLLKALLSNPTTGLSLRKSKTSRSPRSHYHSLFLPKTSSTDCLNGIWSDLKRLDTEIFRSQVCRREKVTAKEDLSKV